MAQWTCDKCGHQEDDEPPGQLVGPFCGLCALCRKCCVSTTCVGTVRTKKMFESLGQTTNLADLEQYL